MAERLPARTPTEASGRAVTRLPGSGGKASAGPELTLYSRSRLELANHVFLETAPASPARSLPFRVRIHFAHYAAAMFTHPRLATASFPSQFHLALASSPGQIRPTARAPLATGW